MQHDKRRPVMDSRAMTGQSLAGIANWGVLKENRQMDICKDCGRKSM